jgi:hypothetical protein
MKLFKRLFCLHQWRKPFNQRTRPAEPFGLATEYEWLCLKCLKIKYSKHEDVPPSVSYED